MGTVIASATGDDDRPRFVDVPAAADTPEKVVRFLTGRLVEGGQLPAAESEQVVERVMRRESLGSTGIGRGMAVPHATCNRIERVACVVGRLPQPVAWSAIDGEAVRMAALVVSPDAEGRVPLRSLEWIVHRLHAGTA
ncbi:PTS sugar transporter subunit IIA [Limnoglobus roseus]|uniref:Fructose-specific EIIABC component of PTS system n=1 Tax=Limnoglobus roseus TaxID=2598579 RepID=A0A5C1ACU2_9BACT|nr:PTS sugar transporter subunit IIA [Limnoglobus roseus]QEL14868.1 fructose-specific EIIABC component of PTS system [Limnoglobus roseus]